MSDLSTTLQSSEKWHTFLFKDASLDSKASNVLVMPPRQNELEN